METSTPWPRNLTKGCGKKGPTGLLFSPCDYSRYRTGAGLHVCSSSIVAALVLQVLALGAIGHHCFLVKFYLDSAVKDTKLRFQLLVRNVENFL